MNNLKCSSTACTDCKHESGGFDSHSVEIIVEYFNFLVVVSKTKCSVKFRHLICNASTGMIYIKTVLKLLFFYLPK